MIARIVLLLQIHEVIEQKEKRLKTAYREREDAHTIG